MEAIRGVRLRKFKLRKIVLGVRMHFRHKQRLHSQSVAEMCRHSVLSGDSIRQCETSSGSRHKDTDQCLYVAISFCRHRSVPVPRENGSAETTVAEGGRNPVAGLPGSHTRWEYYWPPEPTSSYASIDFWCQLVATCKSSDSGFLDVSRSNGDGWTETPVDAAHLDEAWGGQSSSLQPERVKTRD